MFSDSTSTLIAAMQATCIRHRLAVAGIGIRIRHRLAVAGIRIRIARG
ncbi:hypothetical protein ACBY01_13675 [Sphingomonas sp. ac-8]